MVTRFILSDGTFIYASFLSAEDRTALKQKLDTGVTMRCGCRVDEKLEYGISADKRIYPLHQGYAHAKFCSRAVTDNEKRTSPIVYDDDGTSTVYLTFNALNFYYPKSGEDVPEEVNPAKPEKVVAKVIGKDSESKAAPKSNLRYMVSEINRDTYSERVMQGKQATLSEEYFCNTLSARTRRIYLKGINVSLGSLRLEENNIAFVYNKVKSIDDEKGRVILSGSNGKDYSRLVPKITLEKAQVQFEKLYGLSIGEAMDQGHSVFASGFAYRKLSRKGEPYNLFGRVCFFIVNQNGIYCNSLKEVEVLNTVLAFGKTCGGTFLFPDDPDAEYFGIFRVNAQNKEGRIYLGAIPSSENGAAISAEDGLSRERLEEFVMKLCF